MAWTSKILSTDRDRTPYLDAGDPHSPHVIVLVHAFPVGKRMWHSVTIPDGWRAIAPALPGFDGAEPIATATPTIDDYARAVLSVIDHLHIDNAVVGGVSMGGYVTFALWRLARLRWRGVVLADTKAGADTEQAREARQKLLEVVKQQGSRAVAEEMLPKLLGKTTLATRPQLVDEVRRLIERQTGEGLAGAIVRLRDRPDSTPLLPEMGVPALVIVGEEDTVTPPAESETMAAQLDDAQLVRIPGAGHLACMEKPEAFNTALDAFLRTIRY
jgi:pimeloyl-ACP methyl ester carboxylesterase